MQAKLSQKKVCGNCRAYPDDSWKTTCQLGFSVRSEDIIQGLLVRFIPLEPCYKPLNYDDYVTLIELWNQGKLPSQSN